MSIAASIAAAGLVLAGCSSGDDPEASPSDTGDSGETLAFGAEEDIAILEQVTWSEDEAGVPTLEFESPSVVASTATVVVEEGEDEVVAGDVITIDYTITSGGDGSVLYSTYEQDAPESLILDEATMDPVLWDAFTAAGVGGDVLFASIDGSATDPDQSTVYMAVTITESQTPLDRAEGEEVEPAEGLPTVTLGEDGAPSVTIDGADKPEELVVQPLIEGDGATLEEGDTAVVHYTGWVWDGEQFDSSWDRGAPASFPFVTGGLIQGWIDGLAGQTVGSQVLLVIPPELGYGEAGSGETIPGGATLVFVVDILAVA